MQCMVRSQPTMNGIICGKCGCRKLNGLDCSCQINVWSTERWQKETRMLKPINSLGLYMPVWFLSIQYSIIRSANLNQTKQKKIYKEKLHAPHFSSGPKINFAESRLAHKPISPLSVAPLSGQGGKIYQVTAASKPPSYRGERRTWRRTWLRHFQPRSRSSDIEKQDSWSGMSTLVPANH